ncbi:hypothetical protein RHI9324_03544 [Rhizobium sp. CECT 9324]|nr:hypothetical protein RHI9324_03544 [Rhizobium sp. CECT 9324]
MNIADLSKNQPWGEKTLDYDVRVSYLPFSPKSHVPVCVRRPSKWDSSLR